MRLGLDRMGAMGPMDWVGLVGFTTFQVPYGAQSMDTNELQPTT
jgi:hypothetical protein